MRWDSPHCSPTCAVFGRALGSSAVSTADDPTTFWVHWRVRWVRYVHEPYATRRCWRASHWVPRWVWVVRSSPHPTSFRYQLSPWWRSFVHPSFSYRSRMMDPNRTNRCTWRRITDTTQIDMIVGPSRRRSSNNYYFYLHYLDEGVLADHTWHSSRPHSRGCWSTGWYPDTPTTLHRFQCRGPVCSHPATPRN